MASLRRCWLAAFSAIACLILLQGCPKEKRPAESVSQSGNVIVAQPLPNDEVSSPVTVRGRARVFEAALSSRVVSDTGTELGISHFMTSAGAPEFGDFRAEVNFTKPAGVSRGFVEVFSNSPRDGSVQDLVRIPVRFR